MHRMTSHQSRAEYLKKGKAFMSPFSGVSHLCRRAKRRLYCKLQLWMWRKRREKCRFWVARAKKRVCGITSGFRPFPVLKTQSQESKGIHALKIEHAEVKTSSCLCGSGCSEDAFRRQNSRPKLSDSLSGTLGGSSCSQSHITDADVAGETFSQTTTTLLSQIPLKCIHTDKPVQSTHSNARGGIRQFTVPRTMLAKRLEVDGPSGQYTTVTPSKDQTTNVDTDERSSCTNTMSSQTCISLKALNKATQEFLDDFYRIYGSFIPLRNSDVFRHLNRKFDTDLSDRKNVIFAEVARYSTAISQKPVISFRVVYKKHTLTLEDLLTLADQNWLNDQIMNMYGELIVEASHHKVHFLNSFFHRQLMTKGYDGVKRWTKQVDLFSKSLLLVPIHLEVHWCLVTADIVRKKICLYDSQGIALLKVARNILKYLMTEAKEKRQAAFENGWMVSFDEKVPQQTNENDCGVFVLEYSRCLALTRPLRFSQKDIPKIRKRIYKELCDRKLHEQD
ncbi:sentrin-specific protease 5-like [Mugil cephalus]|uniref:sentrin-specific protease 5-like n=1 Tax=Mugil cephalus TaxID=48193 RepID=UPI001FB58353|nr:sentrin-specific protease 5-like [Mugil cephalus]XP_047446536.1 sentrin-specific protease 5-like [Mugil cephalus]